PSAQAAPPAPATHAPSAQAQSAPRSGIALAREAAQASRGAAQRIRGPRGSAASATEADVDPTGGARRDDEDAVVATRNGREAIEKLLGGKVLEVIDETRHTRATRSAAERQPSRGSSMLNRSVRSVAGSVSGVGGVT